MISLLYKSECRKKGSVKKLYGGISQRSYLGILLTCRHTAIVTAISLGINKSVNNAVINVPSL